MDANSTVIRWQEILMAATPKPGWSKPSVILFASEYPANEKAFGLALAQAVESRAELLIFHAFESLDISTSVASANRSYDIAAVRPAKQCFEPLAQRARNLRIHCRIVIRHGLPAEQILTFLRGEQVDRVVMGAHSPGPVGKLLVGSVAEAVLRNANVPVCIAGSYVVEGTYRKCVNRKVLCDVSEQEAGGVVANFAATLAARQNASLILHQVIPPQERLRVLRDHTIDQIEAKLPSLIPFELKRKVSVRTRVALGDPAEELLYQGRTQQANLIVLGAHGASQFAAITRSASVYKVLAYAHCPVITLSPVVLAECGASYEMPHPSEVNFMAGVI
jgi:nucleotide-binding universal stress UspA family protein